MAFRVFLTELRRTSFICLSLFLFCLISGFVFLSSIDLSHYLSTLFQEVNLGVDMVILPKSITPESMLKSLINGQPEALLPLALFETLQKQLTDEVGRKNLTEPPLKILAFLPYQNKEGIAAVAKVGDLKLIREIQKTIWNAYSFKDLSEIKDKLEPKEIYSTDEWKDNVIFGILTVGSNEVLANLKKMIDRRTIAQAYFLNPGHTEVAYKLNKLKMGLSFLMGIIIILAFMGILVTFQKLHIQRKIIFEVFDELQFSYKFKLQLYLFQVVILILIPLGLGLILAQKMFPFVKSLI